MMMLMKMIIKAQLLGEFVFQCFGSYCYIRHIQQF
jgi:hypothetical protein